MEIKICSKCGKGLPKSNDFFYNDYKGNLRGPCKECVKSINQARKKRTNYKSDRKWAHNNKEYYKKYMNNLNNKIREKLGIGYVGLHKWVRNHKPKPSRCSACGEKGYLELHCIDHDYTRVLTKWIYVCKKCHSKANAVIKRTYDP